MLINTSLWISIGFYMFCWVVGVSLNGAAKTIRKKAQEYGYWVAWGVHSFALGAEIWQWMQWPETLVSDLLNLVAWLGIASYLLLNRRIARLINPAVIPVMAIVLLILSAVIGTGHIPRIDLMGYHSWSVQVVLVAHIITLSTGHILFGFSCGASLLFLYQERQIKAKQIRRFTPRLPALGALDKMRYQTALGGFICLSIGVMGGVMLRGLGQTPPEIGLRLGISIAVWFIYAMFLLERTLGNRHWANTFWPIIGFFMVLLAIGVEVYHLSAV